MYDILISGRDNSRFEYSNFYFYDLPRVMMGWKRKETTNYPKVHFCFADISAYVDPSKILQGSKWACGYPFSSETVPNFISREIDKT